ncbi:MAG: alkaline phosphatase [Caldilineaceae bacterium]
MTRTPLQRAFASLLLVALLFGLLPAHVALAQDAPPVLILPTDNATFLPGALFDIRIEVHAEALPDDFAVTVNGEDASTYLGAEAESESWTFGDEAAPTTSQATTWRQVTLPEAGEYLVEVTAGGEVTSAIWTAVPAMPSAGAQNVILFIADGMSVPMLTAARAVSRGHIEGKLASQFAIDQMPEVGLLHTSGLDSIITDSANSASSYNTGHKGALNALGTYPDTSEDTLDDPRVETFASLVKRTLGMSVGIVTTSDWTDATPAAVFGHTRRRGDREFLAADPLDSGLLPEVILGGGGRYMIPATVEGGRREDGRDLFTEYEDAGYTIATTGAELETVVAEAPEKLLGIFHSADMSVWLDRNVFTENLGDFTDQPALDTMTLAALDVLSTNENGFFLMVEAASVDKQMHPLDADRMIADLIEFDNAIAAAVAWASENAPETLIVVTADHGHGYEAYGTVDVEAFNAGTTNEERRDAILLYGDAGFLTYEDADGDFFPDDWAPSIVLAGQVNNFPDYTEDFQVSPVPRVPAIPNEAEIFVDNPDDDPNGIVMSGNLPMDASTGVHTLQDVPVFAAGPGAEFFSGVMENTEVFFGLAYAIGLDPLSDTGLAAEWTEEEMAAMMEMMVEECEGVIFADTCFVR